MTTVVAVLGMHRSGTSWLAGSLEAMGLALGEVETENPFNERGNRENPRILALHSAVFEASGGGWRRPPREVRWDTATRDELAEIVASMSTAYPAWGFKDPRALFLLDEWRRQVPGLCCVGIYRNPQAVARSLANRGSHSAARSEALRMWSSYNRRLLELHDELRFPLLSFDAEPDELERDVVAVAESFGLNANAAGDFFDRSIRHHEGDAGRVPWRCRSVLSRLEAARR